MESIQTVETLSQRRTSQTLKRFHGLTKIAVLLGICTAAALAVVLTTPTPSPAISQNFNIFFDQGSPTFINADWSGTYTLTNGNVTAFSAQIGTCANPTQCKYDVIAPGDFPLSDPGGSNGFHQTVFRGMVDSDKLDYIPLGRMWSTQNQFDTGTRSGVYIVRPIPEPTMTLLLLAGLVVILFMRQRSSAEKAIAAWVRWRISG